MKNPNHEDSNNVVQRIGMHEKSLTLFENYKIRRHYDDHTETWYFSVVDIIAVLLQQPDYQTARKYWNKLKGRMKKEGSQSVTNCHQLELILRKLSEGAKEKELLDSYPRLIKEDIQAAIRYAADTLAHEDTVILSSTRRAARK